MNLAADMEDKTEKHPVTSGEVIPARELLGDLLMQMNKPVEALEAYEKNLKKRRNRFNGVYGAALAAEKTRNTEKPKMYYQQIMSIVNPATCSRSELKHAQQFSLTL